MKFLPHSRDREAELTSSSTGGEKLGHFGKVKAKIRSMFKKYGWKLGVAIVIGYLIRDGLLYIVIPYLIAKNVLSG